MKRFYKYLKSQPSVAVIILIFFCIIEIHFNLKKWESYNVIRWDVLNYYGYLPATFIEKDLKLLSTENADLKYSYVTTPAGQHVIKTSMGMAVMYAPFFGIAHLLSSPLSYSPNGYSKIYQLLICFSGLFYLMFGLSYLRKILLQYYSEKITAWSIFFIFFGTNLLYYSSVESAMSHAYTFSLFSGFLYYVIAYFKKPNKKYSIYLGLFFGLMLLIRPINILLIVVLFLFDIRSIGDIKERVIFFIKNYSHIILFSVISFAVLLPQLLYWKYVTGNFLFFSYINERFYFDNPHIINCLIGFRKGWFIYTPILFFAFIGLFFIKKQASRVFKNTLIILIPLYFYIVSSWWCWWYGGSFGLRPMIDIYPLMCISIAALLMQLEQIKKQTRQIVFTGLLFLVLLNLVQTYQYKRFVIHYDSMTAKAYLNAFGKIESSDTDSTLLVHPDYDKALLGL